MTALEEKQRIALEALSAGDLPVSIQLLRECVSLSESENGEGSLGTAQALFTLALCMFRDRPLTEAKLSEIQSLAERALDIRTSAKGGKDATVAITCEFLATVYQIQDKLEEAESMYRMSLEQAEGLVGPHHVKTANAQLQLGSVMVDLDKFEEAVPLLEKAVETLGRIFGPDSLQTATVLEVLATALEGAGRCDEAKSVLLGSNQTDVVASVYAPDQQAMK